MATSASSRSTSAAFMVQFKCTISLGLARWNSTRRGASQKVPSPSVTARRTSPSTSFLTELRACSRSKDAASILSAALWIFSPSAVARTPSTWRVKRMTPSVCSSSSTLRRNALMDCPSRSDAARKLPLRSTSRKMRTVSQSGTRLGCTSVACSPWGTPCSSAGRRRASPIKKQSPQLSLILSDSTHEFEADMTEHPLRLVRENTPTVKREKAKHYLGNMDSAKYAKYLVLFRATPAMLDPLLDEARLHIP